MRKKVRFHLPSDKPSDEQAFKATILHDSSGSVQAALERSDDSVKAELEGSGGAPLKAELEKKPPITSSDTGGLEANHKEKKPYANMQSDDVPTDWLSLLKFNLFAKIFEFINIVWPRDKSVKFNDLNDIQKTKNKETNENESPKPQTTLTFNTSKNNPTVYRK